MRVGTSLRAAADVRRRGLPGGVPGLPEIRAGRGRERVRAASTIPQKKPLVVLTVEDSDLYQRRFRQIRPGDHRRRRRSSVTVPVLSRLFDDFVDEKILLKRAESKGVRPDRRGEAGRSRPDAGRGRRRSRGRGGGNRSKPSLRSASSSKSTCPSSSGTSRSRTRRSRPITPSTRANTFSPKSCRSARSCSPPRAPRPRSGSA